jgi:hypothetical protein
MLSELKNEVEKTLGRKISSRGDCELLAEDLYIKTGLVVYMALLNFESQGRVLCMR